MFLIRRVCSSKGSLALKVIQEQFTNPRNVHATLFTRGISFNQQRFCVARLQQQPTGKTEEKECKKHPLAQIETRLKLGFTCKKCQTRNNKTISKLGYEKGVVIVRCDGCKNNHLIADNLGWFSGINKKTNIEQILKDKGEHVRRIRNDVDGYMEIVMNEVLLEVQQQQKLNEQSEPDTAQLCETLEEKVELEVKVKHQEAEKSENQEIDEIKKEKR